MTIRIKRDGRIIENAYWFGFNFWARAWVGGRDKDAGWLHWPSSEFDVIAH